MANALYPTFKTLTLSPGADLVAGYVGSGSSSAPTAAPLKAALVSTTSGTTNYTYSSAHQYFSSVPTGSLVAVGVALSGKAAAAGALTASSVVWPSVAQSGTITGQAIVFYLDTGTAGTSPLVAYMDTETGLPVTPNGASITLSFTSSVIALS